MSPTTEGAFGNRVTVALTMPRWMVIGGSPGMLAPFAVALIVACWMRPTAPSRHRAVEAAAVDGQRA
jgi:hypothetical protein